MQLWLGCYIIRRRSLKQAQLALHQELQPYTHKKPILRTTLCTAIDEIKVRPQHRIEVGEVIFNLYISAVYLQIHRI